MTRPVLSSRTNTIAKLLQYAENVYVKTTENSDLFPPIVALLPQLKTDIERIRAAIAEAAFRGLREIKLKNQQAVKLHDQLRNIAFYVNMIAAGDSAVILAAGFIPSKSTANNPCQSPQPTDFRVEIKQQGLCRIHMRVKVWHKARYYKFEYRKVDSEDAWTALLSGKCRAVVHGLQHLQLYEFRVTYLGTDPTPNYSNTVQCYAV